MEREVVRGLMLLRLSTLATGRTGVRPELAELMVAVLNAVPWGERGAATPPPGLSGRGAAFSAGLVARVGVVAAADRRDDNKNENGAFH